MQVNNDMRARMLADLETVKPVVPWAPDDAQSIEELQEMWGYGQGQTYDTVKDFIAKKKWAVGRKQGADAKKRFYWKL